jgi:Helix-turn-helix domain
MASKKRGKSPRVAMASPFATTAEAAEFLRCSKRTLEGWRFRGVGPRFIRAGDLIRYQVDDLRSWLLSGLTEATAIPAEQTDADGVRG